jgi:hypothetical protein
MWESCHQRFLLTRECTFSVDGGYVEIVICNSERVRGWGQEWCLCAYSVGMAVHTDSGLANSVHHTMLCRPPTCANATCICATCNLVEDKEEVH